MVPAPTEPGRAVPVALSVGGGAAVEMVALDHAGEALALGDGLDIDAVADAEDFADVEHGADCDLGELGGFGAELANALQRAVAAGVTALGLVDAPVGAGAEADLDGRVTVAGGSHELGDRAGPDFEHGAADDAAVVADELHHAELLTEEARY